RHRGEGYEQLAAGPRRLPRPARFDPAELCSRVHPVRDLRVNVHTPLMGQNGVVSTTFPRVRRSQRGYHVDEVEGFLESARVAYSAEPGSPHALDSGAIRQTAFRLARGGYSTDHVDRALERLEDAFAARERERQRRELGDAAFNAEVRDLAREIVARLDR